MKYMNEYLQKSSCLIWRGGAMIIALRKSYFDRQIVKIKFLLGGYRITF